MLLPISHDLKYKNIGDCKLVLFSHLLSHYDIEVSPGDLLVATAGLDFSLFKYQIGTQSCFFISGRRLCIEDEYAKLIGLNAFYVRPAKPTHGLKSFSWTCSGNASTERRCKPLGCGHTKKTPSGGF